MNLLKSSHAPRGSAAFSPRSSRRCPPLVLGALLAIPWFVACDARSARQAKPEVATSTVRQWNQVAIDASGLDHTPADQGPAHTPGHQAGPCRSSRAMAIVHVAMFEAVNSIRGDFPSFVGLAPAEPGTVPGIALAQAAHDTLVALFPSQAGIFDEHLVTSLQQAGRPDAKSIEVGRAAAAAVLQHRAFDGSQHAEPRVNVDHLCSSQPGHWRQDPISQHPLALGAHWGQVSPWCLRDGSQFRCPPPPDMTSAEYAAAFAEVVAVGGDGVHTPTLRTEQETFVGIFWAYDGTPSLCAPPRLYNQIAVQIAEQMGTTGIEFARLLALANVAMADAGIAAWESKYFHDTWRPVTGVREADPGTGPLGLGDGNPGTLGDATFTPLGAPASNLAGPNFTPPFPSYPSGHATFGGALFQVLRRFYGTDAIEFTFVSDEWNGRTRDNQGVVRPFVPRDFATLSQAEEENGQSRIYLGIHWSFDKVAGIEQGNAVGDWVVDHLYTVK